MKKSTKSLLFGVLGAAILAGAYQNYRMSQTEEIASNLTLADLEAMAFEEPIEPDLWQPGDNCEARTTCSNGAEIFCTGSSSCSSGKDKYGLKFVICDGNMSASCL